MKTFYKLFIAVVTGLFICTSCSDDESKVFKVDTGLIRAIPGGGSSSFMVASDGYAWTVKSDQPWCKLSPESGTKDEIVQVTIDQTQLGEVRTAKVTITAGDQTKELLVTQEGIAPELGILPAVGLTVVEVDGTSDLAITSNRSWKAESDATWCKLAIGAEAASSVNSEGNKTLKASYTPNTGSTTRTANIKFTAGTLEKVFTIIQESSDFSFTMTPALSSCMPDGGTNSVYVGMSAAWTATSNVPWCTLENAASRSKGTFTATCAVLPAGTDERVATITLVSGGETKTVQIIQSAKQMIDTRDGKSYKIVKMPDGKWWMAENLAYTKGLTYNAYTNQANGKTFTASYETVGSANISSGYNAIGSYWCNGRNEADPISAGPFNNHDQLLTTYGALYTWETVMMVDGLYADDKRAASGPGAWDEGEVSSYAANTPATQASAKENNAHGANNRGIAPQGWHIPTENEWCVMLDAVDSHLTGGSSFPFLTQTGVTGSSSYGGTDAGLKLKSANNAPVGIKNTNTDTNPQWDYSLGAGTDEYGFCVIPAGYRSGTGNTHYYRGNTGIFWTASARNNGTTAFAKSFVTTDNSFNTSLKVTRVTPARAQGCSVRCVKD